MRYSFNATAWGGPLSPAVYCQLDGLQRTYSTLEQHVYLKCEENYINGQPQRGVYYVWSKGAQEIFYRGVLIPDSQGLYKDGIERVFDNEGALLLQIQGYNSRLRSLR